LFVVTLLALILARVEIYRDTSDPPGGSIFGKRGPRKPARISKSNNNAFTLPHSTAYTIQGQL
jgi:hypothetical protein